MKPERKRRLKQPTQTGKTYTKSKGGRDVKAGRSKEAQRKRIPTTKTQKSDRLLTRQASTEPKGQVSSRKVLGKINNNVKDFSERITAHFDFLIPLEMHVHKLIGSDKKNDTLHKKVQELFLADASFRTNILNCLGEATDYVALMKKTDKIDQKTLHSLIDFHNTIEGFLSTHPKKLTPEKVIEVKEKIQEWISSKAVESQINKMPEGKVKENLKKHITEMNEMLKTFDLIEKSMKKSSLTEAQVKEILSAEKSEAIAAGGTDMGMGEVLVDIALKVLATSMLVMLAGIAFFISIELAAGAGLGYLGARYLGSDTDSSNKQSLIGSPKEHKEYEEKIKYLTGILNKGIDN